MTCGAQKQVYYFTKLRNEPLTILPDVVECDLPEGHNNHHEGRVQEGRLAFQREAYSKTP